MDVRLVTDGGIEEQPAERLVDLLAEGRGTVWVDIPSCDQASLDVLRRVFRFHPAAVRDCAQRNRVPRLHAYRDHLFLILHAPELGAGGHVHFVELDQFIGRGYLVTVHGPVNPAVDPRAALRETLQVRERIAQGRLRPTSPMELSHALVRALVRRQEEFLETLTTQVWSLEQRVTGGPLGNPEELLEELFRVRHGLLALHTMCVSSHQVYAPVAAYLPPGEKRLVADIVDRFDRLRALADAQRDYLQGVIEFYRTRTETKMTIAAERLAVIAAVTLPVTALSSILGMNIIVSHATRVVPLIIVVAVMVAMSAALLTWARRRGWF